MTAEGASHIIRYLLSIVHASSFAAPSPTAQTRPIIRWLASMWRANVSNPSQTEPRNGWSAQHGRDNVFVCWRMWPEQKTK
jgi:hypothetical protein